MTLALGIDPGTAICGFGLVEAQNGRLRPVRFGAVTTDKQCPPQERLAIIYAELTKIITEYDPDLMAVEQLFFNRNVTTAMTVGQARGVILLAAAHRKIKVAEYTPLQIKQAVTGYGNATKEQVTFMIQRILGIKEKPRPDDAADALAAAICALHFAGGG
ncbi:MAG: crossover junction endodeoxyribonuclease RuvC [Acidaminococcales bacterium]|jgi:crossover junction endodeoxyribonuclease RuvC|nr:crossover junction endodeoxyribonuclease RuvC [Acidaminococcales bacterium]